MKFKIAILCSVFLAGNNLSFAQKQAEVNRTTVETKFYRPSLTNLFIQPKSSEARVVVDEFKKLDLEKRFDNNGVANNTISVTLPEPPQRPTSDNALELVALLKDYRKALKVYEEQKSLAIQNQVKPITKQVIAKWWNRDASGNMSTTLIKSRGLFTATDGDVIKDKTSEISRVKNLGYELLKRSYITVYEITDVKSMDQVYNERDAAARIAAQKSKTEFKPVPRTQEGYQASYNAITYKIVWNDSVQTVFFDQYFVNDATPSADRASKIKAFENSDYPLVQVASVSGDASSTQSNDPKTYGGLLGRVRKSMDQLLREMPASIQESTMSKTTKLVEDFQIKAPIFVTYPTQVKIGTKEGIYIDERFMVYQKVVDEKTKMESKKKIGMVRVKSIADNDVVANGESKASLFQQQAGKKLNSGNFVQMKEDLGISVMIGYGVGDNAMGGVYASLDQRVSRYFKNKFARGVHLTAGANITGFTDQNIVLGDTTTAYSGSVLNYSVGIGKEIYFTKRGHLFLYPSVSYSLHSITLDKRKGEDISETNTSSLFAGNVYDEEDYTWSTSGLLASLGIGYNFSASFSLLIRPSISYKLGEYTTGSGIELPAATNFSNAWNMDKVSDMSIPIYIGLRYKF
jgi:hypothetical protein